MSRTARSLYAYRTLLATLTNRELKARYRGSFLGWAWSLANPIVLLVVYSFVFTIIFPAPTRASDVSPYPLFLVSGLFAWIWLQSSLMEGTNALLANAGLIRKATFPAELLPVVPVLSNLVHFALALPIIGVAMGWARYRGIEVSGMAALAAPLVALVQLPMLAGASLALAALNAHFKDIKDLLNNALTLLFFATPILYPLSFLAEHPWAQRMVALNPLTAFAQAYQQTLFFGQLPSARAWLTMIAISLVTWWLGALLFERLRDTLVEAV